LINFLRENSLIQLEYNCPKEDCKKRPKNLNFEFLEQRLIIRCQNSKCRQYVTARNEVFSLESSSNLPIEKILEVYWYWSFKQKVNYTSVQCDLSEKTVVYWFKKIRNILFESMNESQPMGGPGYRIQIDESLFQGKRKNNKGRLLKSDVNSKNSFKKKNYGNRVQGPWVFGLVCQKISDIRNVQSIKV
jgi:hypothetical protein